MFSVQNRYESYYFSTDTYNYHYLVKKIIVHEINFVHIRLCPIDM